MVSRREVAAFVALTAIWGTTWAAIRVGLTGIPPLAGLAARFLLAGAILLAIAVARGVPLGRSALERRLWWVNGLATFLVPYTVIYWAEQWVPSGLSSVLFSTFPLWVVVLGLWILPHERASGARRAGVALGFLGVAVLFSEDFTRLGGLHVRLPAAVLVAGAAVSASGSLAMRRWGGGVSPLSLTAIPMLGTGLATGLGALWLERDRPWNFGPAAVAATVYLALFGSAVTFTIYFWLLKRRTAMTASLVSYTAPVVAVAVGTLAFDEPFTLRSAIGAVLVLAGVAAALAGGRPARLREVREGG
jgi:drug/metabolite transporter (DMT)-like permease